MNSLQVQSAGLAVFRQVKENKNIKVSLIQYTVSETVSPFFLFSLRQVKDELIAEPRVEWLLLQDNPR